MESTSDDNVYEDYELEYCPLCGAKLSGTTCVRCPNCGYREGCTP